MVANSGVLHTRHMQSGEAWHGTVCHQYSGSAWSMAQYCLPSVFRQCLKHGTVLSAISIQAVLEAWHGTVCHQYSGSAWSMARYCLSSVFRQCLKHGTVLSAISIQAVLEAWHGTVCHQYSGSAWSMARYCLPSVFRQCLLLPLQIWSQSASGLAITGKNVMCKTHSGWLLFYIAQHKIRIHK
jgi:hypothetical protein